MFAYVFVNVLLLFAGVSVYLILNSLRKAKCAEYRCTSY